MSQISLYQANDCRLKQKDPLKSILQTRWSHNTSFQPLNQQEVGSIAEQLLFLLTLTSSWFLFASSFTMAAACVLVSLHGEANHLETKRTWI